MEWTGLDSVEWTGLDSVEWTGLDWTGLSGVEWTRLDWSGLEWTGLDWTGLDSNPVDSPPNICILGGVHMDYGGDSKVLDHSHPMNFQMGLDSETCAFDIGYNKQYLP